MYVCVYYIWVCIHTPRGGPESHGILVARQFGVECLQYCCEALPRHTSPLTNEDLASTLIVQPVPEQKAPDS